MNRPPIHLKIKLFPLEAFCFTKNIIIEARQLLKIFYACMFTANACIYDQQAQ